jgi:glycosyltransferase involved in cell wall biosynthesis
MKASPRQAVERLCYLAYPTSLTLKAANAIQTYLTVRELRALCPDLLVIVPRLGREPSAFIDVGAVHLPRIPIGKLSRFFPSTGWYYIERSVFAWLVVLYLAARRLFCGERIPLIYVREVICAWWLTLGLARLLGARVAYEAHELESRNPSRARGRLWQPLLRRLDRTLLHRADLVVSLTETFAQELREQGWRPTGPIAVLPDAYDEGLYRPLSREQSREALGIPHEEEVVVYSGITFSYRGLEQLLGAIALLAAQRPHLHAYLVGGKPREIAVLAQRAQEAGIQDRVHFQGMLERHRIPLYLAAADALVIPGTVSGASASPLKMFEYMAMERPIVVVDIPALREILDERCAYLFPEGRVEALAHTLAWLLDHPEEARRRAAVARERAAAYTYRKRAERLLGIAQQLTTPGTCDRLTL